MAGGIGGRAHLHGVADEARRSIPAQCMGLLCMPASGAHVHAVKGAGNTGEVCAARNSGLWRAQQVCAAGAQQARAVPWAGRGSTPLRAAPALGDLRESQRTFESKFKGPAFKASAQLSNPPKSPAPGRSGVLPLSLIHI